MKYQAVKSTLAIDSGIMRRVLMLLCLSLPIGCTPRDSGPETYPATGRVARAGKPVEGAVVTFHANTGGRTAMAVTDDTGAFEVSTYYNNGLQIKQGMVTGDYLVTIVKLDSAPAKSAMQPPKNLLPPRYAIRDRSGLTATVTGDNANEFSFDLD